LTFGAEYQEHLRVNFVNFDDAAINVKLDLPYALWSFYLQQENQLTKNLALTVGIRWDDYSTLGDASAPRAALVYHPRPTSTLKLLYGEAFRAPSPWESKTDAPPNKSNPGLLPERIKTREAVWEERLNATLFGALSLYNYTMRDLIDPVVDPLDSLTQYRNISRAKAYGMEIEFEARLASRFQGFASLTYQNAKNAKAKKQTLTNSPRHLVKLGAVAPLGNFF